MKKLNIWKTSQICPHLNISPFLLSHRTQNVPCPPSQVMDSTRANEATSLLHVIYSSHISQCFPTVITNYPISVFLSNHNRIQLSSHELRASPERKLLHLSCSETQQPLSYGSRSEARENGGQKGMFLKGCLWNRAWWSVWVVGFIRWHSVCGVYQWGVMPVQELYLIHWNSRGFYEMQTCRAKHNCTALFQREAWKQLRTLSLQSLAGDSCELVRWRAETALLSRCRQGIKLLCVSGWDRWSLELCLTCQGTPPTSASTHHPQFRHFLICSYYLKNCSCRVF